MLSKRNFAMMMTMIVVVLVLFLSSVVLKEYFNDYDVNHAAETEVIEKKERTGGKKNTGQDIARTEQPVFYIGTKKNGYYPAMKEWAQYRKKTFRVCKTVNAAGKKMQKQGIQKAYLLVDGKRIEKNVEQASEKLSSYVQQGCVVIFYRLPSYRAIEKSVVLQDLLGIQHLRAESVKLHEIRLYSGFLLGGETCYSFEGVKETELVDLDREVPWYDISSRTKSYMVGFISAKEKAAMNLNNEDMPAIIWRSSTGNGPVFAVNGDYMKGETCLGMLDAMVYEAEDYALYSVVNAQNLFVAGFPDLTVENEEIMAETYGMTTQQFCRDVLWPSLVAAAQKGSWKLTSFLAIRQSDQSWNEPSRENLIEYLKYFNEESAEAGTQLGRMHTPDIRLSVQEEREMLKDWEITYAFTGGYVRKENKEQLASLLDKNGKLKFFQDIRTVVGEYETEGQIVSWMTDQITLQSATATAYQHKYTESLRLKSLETALGYSNIQVDIYQVLWPESRNDEWEKVAEKMAAHIDTYWKPFAAFEKTTITQSDSRVRNFLNGSVQSARNENEILIQTEDFTGDAYALLRTHGEILKEMAGGDWKQVEDNAYLLHLTSENASVVLKPEREPYYKK